MAAEKQKTESESEHLKRAATFTASEHEVQKLEKKLQRFILKTREYFEQKENLVCSDFYRYCDLSPNASLPNTSSPNSFRQKSSPNLTKPDLT